MGGACSGEGWGGVSVLTLILTLTHLAEPQLLDDAPHASLPPPPAAVRRQLQARVEAEVLPHRRRAG